MITASELNRARSDAARFLPSTGTISYYTAVSNDAGGGSVSWVNRATIPLRVAPLTGDEAERGEQIAEQSDWVITMEALTTIEVEDMMEIEGETYSVTAIRERDYEVTRRVEARKL